MDNTPTLARSATPTGLFWNERGAIACERHIPHPGSDTWNWERWEPLGVVDAQEWCDGTDGLPQCECCGAIADVEPF